MAIRSHKTNQKAPTLSRVDKWRRNPLPWIIIILVTGGLSFMFIWPMADDYLHKKTEITTFETENPTLEKKQENLQIEFDEIKAEFDEAASEIRQKENQIFPEAIDTNKIIKILELFSLVLTYDLDGSSYFSLDTVNFAGNRPKKDQEYAQLMTTIKAVGTKKDINNFVDFIKTGEIPKAVDKQVRSASDLTIDLQFLRQNLLPLASLNSIRINKYNSKNTVKDLLSVELQVNFYSQP